MSFVDELAETARLRFVRWDHGLWQRFLSGPAVQMSQGLGDAPGDSVATERLFQSYLRLACEGVGQGYLFPAESGAENVFGLTWNSLLPRLLPKVAAEKRAATLAACWNLGENLELSPLWLRRLVHRALVDLPSLEALEQVITQVAGEAFSDTDAPLREVGRLAWVDLSAEDRRFLPGALHYLAARVVCVHDRERTGGSGLEALTCGIFLGATPRLLGPMGCKETVVPTPLDAPLLRAATKQDLRFDLPYAAARAEGSAVASLVASQFVVALLP